MPNPNTSAKTIERIEDVYRDYQRSLVECHAADEEVLDAKDALDMALVGLRLEGKLTGKNEPEREAQARQLLREQHSALSAALRTQRRARLQFSLAEADVELVRLQVRFQGFALQREMWNARDAEAA